MTVSDLQQSFSLWHSSTLCDRTIISRKPCYHKETACNLPHPYFTRNSGV